MRRGVSTFGAHEGGVAEAEDPAVRGHQPVAPAVRGGGHAHDRCVQGTAQRVHAEGRAAERDDRIGSGGETLGAGRRHRCARPTCERTRKDRHYRHEQQEGQNLCHGPPPRPVTQV